MMNNYQDKQRPPCNVDCWHYGVFGGVEGCGQRENKTGNPWPEPIELGEPCFHPEDRDICEPVYIGSVLGLCAALEGEVIQGGLHDNSSIVKLLTNSEK